MMSPLVLFILVVIFNGVICSDHGDEEIRKLLSNQKALQNIVDRLDKENAELKRTVNRLEQRIDLNEARQESVKVKTGDSKTDHTTIERQSRLLMGNPDNNVAFTAKLGAHAQGLGVHQTVIFENVHTNIGGAYSADTGVFTAPHDGVYFFIATIMAASGDYIETEMVHNGKHVVYMYAADTTRYEQGTNSAVLSMQAGDHVWVRTVDADSHTVFGGDWSSLTGFRLS